MNWRELLLPLQRRSGLVLGVLIFVIAVTGSALVFEHDIIVVRRPGTSVT